MLCKDFQFKDTICNATELRQESAIKLAKEVDTMIVIGGSNSGNTMRLVSTCEEHCKSVHHVESVEGLNIDMFHNSSTVGVTAGASTPDYLINEVVEYIKNID